MRHADVVLASILVATLAVVGVSAVEPRMAEAAVKGCSGGDVRLSAAEKAMLQLHNRKRASRDLPRLCAHPRLQKAANAHSRERIRRGRFTHGNTGRRLRKVRLPLARLRREHRPRQRPPITRDDLQGLDAKLLPQVEHPRT